MPEQKTANNWVVGSDVRKEILGQRWMCAFVTDESSKYKGNSKSGPFLGYWDQAGLIQN